MQTSPQAAAWRLIDRGFSEFWGGRAPGIAHASGRPQGHWPKPDADWSKPVTGSADDPSIHRNAPAGRTTNKLPILHHALQTNCSAHGHGRSSRVFAKTLLVAPDGREHGMPTGNHQLQLAARYRDHPSEHNHAAVRRFAPQSAPVSAKQLATGARRASETGSCAKSTASNRSTGLASVGSYFTPTASVMR